MRIVMMAALGLLLCQTSVFSSDWARSMFTATSHDFGTVARAAKTEYRFEFENRSNQTLHVRSVRTSCVVHHPHDRNGNRSARWDGGDFGQVQYAFSHRPTTSDRHCDL